MTKITMDREMENRLMEVQQIEKKLFAALEKYDENPSKHNRGTVCHFRDMYAKYLVK